MKKPFAVYRLLRASKTSKGGGRLDRFAPGLTGYVSGASEIIGE